MGVWLTGSRLNVFLVPIQVCIIISILWLVDISGPYNNMWICRSVCGTQHIWSCKGNGTSIYGRTGLCEKLHRMHSVWRNHERSWLFSSTKRNNCELYLLYNEMSRNLSFYGPLIHIPEHLHVLNKFFSCALKYENYQLSVWLLCLRFFFI